MMRIREKMWIMLGLLLMAVIPAVEARAGSAMIQFGTSSQEVREGDVFTVVCQVTSGDPFLDMEFQIEYDAEQVQFLKGGSRISGDNGILTVSSVGNETASAKKTFSMQFVAVKKGMALFGVKGTASIRDEEGTSFSSSSNQLSIAVRNKAAKSTPQPSGQPSVTPEPELSDNNRLKDLKVNAIDFTPVFTTGRNKYAVTVDNGTDTLYVSFRAEDEKAVVRLKGNENLKEGANMVSIVVTAQNGAVRTYRLSVTRETAAETAARLGTDTPGEAGNGGSADSTAPPDISFQVAASGKQVILKNSYEFEVLDPSGLKEIPAGYILSEIEVGGTGIPAFTMQNDLDGRYLLMYLKGPSGENGIYQYDRTEKTLQRYTGSMIDKVNKSAGQDGGRDGESLSSYVMPGIIIILAIIILCMRITMLNMVMKKKGK